MNCSNHNYQGLGECKNLRPVNPIKGIEIEFITNKDVKIQSVMHDGEKRPVTNSDITLVINKEEFHFYKMDDGTFRTVKELF